MKKKSLSEHLKDHIEQLIEEKGDENISDSRRLQRTCSAVVFTGLTTGSLTVVESHRKSVADKGISISDETLQINLSEFPELNKSNGFLWITDSDLIILRSPDGEFKAYTSVCAYWQKKQMLSSESDKLRCPSTLEWTFDIHHHPTDEEDGHLTEFPVQLAGNALLIELAATKKA